MQWPGATISAAMNDLVFESTRTVAQDDFEEWAHERARQGDVAHYELLHGRIVMTPPAGYPHGEVASRLQGIVGPLVRAAGLGKVFDSSQGFALPSGDTLEPDTAFVSSARWSAAPSPVEGKFLRVVPDVVFEILSASTASHDCGEKKGIYARNGVREYWLVDPRARELVVFDLEGDHYGSERVFAAGEAAGSRVIAGLTIDVDDVMP